MPNNPVLRKGTIVGNRYRILRLIGEGGAAHVYLVEHSDLGTPHALKQQTLDQQEEGLPEVTVESAQREARFLSNLSHPSLPKVTDFFREGDDVYLVMDYIEGINLKEKMDAQGEKPCDIMQVVRWGVQICDVLSYLHTQEPPIIYRDVKPGNIIVRPDDTLSIVDFGIARQVRRGASSDTIRFGSEGYAPPEQYGKDGHSQTEPRSDLYALGATLHHLLTGRDPSNAPFKWPSVRVLNPLVPLVLDKLVMRCVEMEVVRRPESAEAVSRALRMTLQMLEETNRSLLNYSRPLPSTDLNGLPAPEREGNQEATAQAVTATVDALMAQNPGEAVEDVHIPRHYAPTPLEITAEVVLPDNTEAESGLLNSLTRWFRRRPS